MNINVCRFCLRPQFIILFCERQFDILNSTIDCDIGDVLRLQNQCSTLFVHPVHDWDYRTLPAIIYSNLWHRLPQVSVIAVCRSSRSSVVMIQHNIRTDLCSFRRSDRTSEFKFLIFKSVKKIEKSTFLQACQCRTDVCELLLVGYSWQIPNKSLRFKLSA